MDFLRHKSSFVAAILILFFLALSLHLATQESLTFDERAHIPAAYSYLRFGDIRLNPEHPPLLKDLAALPLLFLDLEFPINSQEWQNGPNEQWTVGSKFISCTHPEEACNNARQIAFWSRLPLILLATFFAGFLFWWTRKLSGPLAGLLALSFMVFDPNFIAHGHYVTTDIGIAAFLFFVFYFFIQFLKHPSWKNTWGLAVFFTLAQLVKFSAILLIPVFGLFLLLYALIKPHDQKYSSSNLRWRIHVLATYFGKALIIFLFYVVVVWIVYYFHTLGTPSEHLNAIARQMFPEKELGPLARHIVAITSEGTFTKPYSAYLLGLMMVFGRVAGGNTYYFLGTVQKEASPLYFPLIFFTKETLPFLFLLLVTTLYGTGRVLAALYHTHLHQENFTRTLQTLLLKHLDTSLMVFFVLFYSLLSITGNLNIGFRHLFPIVPFLYLLVAKSAVHMYKNPHLSPSYRRVLGYCFGVLIFFQILTPIFAYPYFLSYYNPLVGGTAKGYIIAADSNYDWGQDLLRLKKFILYHNSCVKQTALQTFNCAPYLPTLPPIEKIHTDYFGGDEASVVLRPYFENWWSHKPPENGWFAISLNNLQENSVLQNRGAGGQGYLWLKDYEPVAKAGTSIFIYYIPEK